MNKNVIEKLKELDLEGLSRSEAIVKRREVMADAYLQAGGDENTESSLGETVTFPAQFGLTSFRFLGEGGLSINLRIPPDFAENGFDIRWYADMPVLVTITPITFELEPVE